MTAQTAGRRVRRILAALSRRSPAGLRLLRKTRTRRSHLRDAARSAGEIHLIEPTWHWYLLVALGSGLGGAGRLFVSTLVGRVAGYGFPWGTIVVNVLGCFAVGALGALFAPSNPLHLRHDLRMLLIVGILGGFTTFSAFSLEALQLVQRGAVGYAAAYVTASVVLCLLAAALSYAAVTALLR
jgi:CrcB protein